MVIKFRFVNLMTDMKLTYSTLLANWLNIPLKPNYLGTKIFEPYCLHLGLSSTKLINNCRLERKMNIHNGVKSSSDSSSDMMF